MIFGAGVDEDNGKARVWLCLDGEEKRTLCEAVSLEQCDLICVGLITGFLAACSDYELSIELFREIMKEVRKLSLEGGNSMHDPVVLR